MYKLIGEIIPLGIASALSPGILMVTVILLGRKNKPVLNSIVFLLGQVLTVIILIVVGYFIGTLTSKPSKWDQYLDLLIGALFLFFAYKAYKSKGDRVDPNAEKQSRYWLIFILGFIISITNADAETIFLVEMKEIFSATVSELNKILLISYAIFMFLIACILPIFIYLVFPKKSQAVFTRINSFLAKYAKPIIVAMFLIFAVWFIFKGFDIKL